MNTPAINMCDQEQVPLYVWYCTKLEVTNHEEAAEHTKKEDKATKETTLLECNLEYKTGKN